MDNFNWEEFKKGGVAVHCAKDEEVKDFLEECKINNIEVDESSIKEDRKVLNYLNCYDFDDGELDSSYFDYYSTRNYKIIEWKVDKMKKKGYLANGLFSLGDRLVNELLAKEIRQAIDIDLYVPQENMAINDKQAYASSIQIYDADYNHLKETDYVVAVIDGVEVDSGVAAEVGIASAMGKKIYTLYTDTRQQGTENSKKIDALVEDPTENQFMYRNLFLIGLIKRNGYVFNNIEDLVEKLKEDIERQL